MVLIQDILSFTSNKMPYHAGFSLLQSILKVFYLLKVKLQFENDEMTGLWIQCDHCNITVTCK